MDTGYTIVVGNPDKLSVLCGANDVNLRVIENYLGSQVVSRGNELTVASSDAVICRKFQNLVDKVLTEPQYGQASPETLSTLLSGLDDSASVSMSDACIQIPHALKRIYPRTVRQAELILQLQKRDVVFCLGPAGTGKTFIAMAHALKLALSKQVSRIILTRPVVEAGESLGFLPGDLEEKINPYVRPLYDAMEKLLPPETIRRMEDSNIIEVAPLAYMRGRSLDNAVILLDEAQNTTVEQMKMFLTRLGEGSRAIITGDPTQTDLPSRIPSGLAHAVSVLQNIDEIAILAFENRDVVRNSLVRKIVQAYEQEKN